MIEVKYKLCPHCQGLGKVPDGYCKEPCVTCPTCNGLRVVEVEE